MKDGTEPPCVNCPFTRYRPLLKERLVTDRELHNPEFIRDVRRLAYSLGLSASQWRAYLTDEYSRFQGIIIDEYGRQVELDLDVFEVDDKTLFNHCPGSEKTVSIANNRIRERFDYICCTPCPANVIPRIREEAREFFRVLATILRARNPGAAILWGVKPANDNNPDN